MWEKTKSAVGLAYRTLRAAANHFSRDRVGRMAAAVAYRTMFALAPLLLVGISILGRVLGGDQAARARFLAEVALLAGDEIGEALGLFLENARVTGDTAAVLGFALLLWTASSLFLELQADLNDIFSVPQEDLSGWRRAAGKRALGFLWVIVFGLALIAVWVVNAVWQFLGGLLPGMLGVLGGVFAFIAPVVSLLVLPFLLAIAFRTLTKAAMRWRAIWWGSFFTAVVFIAAAYLIGLYFRWTTEPNAVNVAGSIFVILLLAFVLSAVFLYGAEVIKVVHGYLETGTVLIPGSSPPETSEAPASAADPVPLGPVAAFFAGLFIGRRRRRR